MSRFGNLEFNDEFEHDAQAQAVSKDAAFYLAEARRSFEQADFEKALRACAKALEFDPQSPAAWSGQARALIELGEFHEARLWAEKGLERLPHEPELLAAKAVALGRAGALDEALACSDASIEERGDTPYVWLARADVLLARKETRADYCFEKAMGLARHDWFTAWLAARIRHYYRQFLGAMKLLQQALECDATRFVLWLELGQCQLALGLAGAAERSLDRALELQPGCTAARLAKTRASGSGIGTRLSGWWRRLFRS